MGTELFYPFSLNPQGGIASTTDANLIPLQHIEALIGTAPGERVMLPSYGVPAASYVFENGSGAVAASLANDVEQAVAFWEPTLTVLSVTPVPDPSNESYGMASVDVEFTQTSDTTSGVNTATVEVGGNVVQSVIANAS